MRPEKVSIRPCQVFHTAVEPRPYPRSPTWMRKSRSSAPVMRSVRYLQVAAAPSPAVMCMSARKTKRTGSPMGLPVTNDVSWPTVPFWVGTT
jgi:hypothetical protein